MTGAVERAEEAGAVAAGEITGKAMAVAALEQLRRDGKL